MRNCLSLPLSSSKLPLFNIFPSLLILIYSEIDRTGVRTENKRSWLRVFFPSSPWNRSRTSGLFTGRLAWQQVVHTCVRCRAIQGEKIWSSIVYKKRGLFHQNNNHNGPQPQAITLAASFYSYLPIKYIYIIYLLKTHAERWKQEKGPRNVSVHVRGASRESPIAPPARLSVCLLSLHVCVSEISNSTKNSTPHRPCGGPAPCCVGDLNPDHMCSSCLIYDQGHGRFHNNCHPNNIIYEHQFERAVLFF